MSIADQPAFPAPEVFRDDRQRTRLAMPGMTYRQWLIGQALKGLLASNDDPPALKAKDVEGQIAEMEIYAAMFAQSAVRFADAVIKNLETEAKP